MALHLVKPTAIVLQGSDFSSHALTDSRHIFMLDCLVNWCERDFKDFFLAVGYSIENYSGKEIRQRMFECKDQWRAMASYRYRVGDLESYSPSQFTILAFNFVEKFCEMKIRFNGFQPTTLLMMKIGTAAGKFFDNLMGNMRHEYVKSYLGIRENSERLREDIRAGQKIKAQKSKTSALLLVKE